MRRERHIARMGEMKNAYSIWVGKPTGKRPLGRQRRRWEIFECILGKNVSGPRPASYPVGTMYSFPGGKAAGA